MRIIDMPIPKKELIPMSGRLGGLIKAVVDIRKEVMAIDADLHADEEAYLMKVGSRQSDLWGINLYPDTQGEDWIEFDSMINLRPAENNLTRGVDNPEIQKKIRAVVSKLIR